MLALGTKVKINPDIEITDDADPQVLALQKDATVGEIVDVSLAYIYPYEVKFFYRWRIFLMNQKNLMRHSGHSANLS